MTSTSITIDFENRAARASAVVDLPLAGDPTRRMMVTIRPAPMRLQPAQPQVKVRIAVVEAASSTQSVLFHRNPNPDGLEVRLNDAAELPLTVSQIVFKLAV
jgi:hypothetical protein